jgi:hypothetical protein
MKSDLWEREPYLFLIKCPIEVAEKREDQRGGFRGLARGMRDMDFEKDVDFIVNTGDITPKQAAEQIMNYMQTNKPKEPSFLLETAGQQIIQRKKDIKEEKSDLREIKQTIKHKRRRKKRNKRSLF